MSGGCPGQGFPDACLRGIRIRKWITEGYGGFVLTGEAYAFDPADRQDAWCPGWHEASINWEDDQDAVEFTRSQRSRSGLPLNPHGVGRLPRSEVEKCRAFENVGDILRYERREDAAQRENRYHGNLLLDPALHLQFRRLIAGTLGLATRVIVSIASTPTSSSG